MYERPGIPCDIHEDVARVTAAYDGIAAGYDLLVAEDAWMRELLWAHHLRLFRPGNRVLDVGCGTGLDTLHLAARGLRLTAIDASPGMLAVLRRKAAALPATAGRITLCAADAASLDGWPAARFDGILSSFAGLNTVDLPRFAAAAARLLRPGGRMVLHLLAPSDEGQELTVVIAGRPVRHALPSAAEAYRRHFAAAFALRRSYGLGWLWPRRLGRRLPAAALRPLGWIDATLGAMPPFRGWCRFFVLDLERRVRGQDAAPSSPETSASRFQRNGLQRPQGLGAGPP
jgi:ubiquinone/menaquinone biosynthesis C-methylase UbiE